ncbi:MAG: hypothetical protein MJ184_00635 [Treponema sp.]|uniref:hypothetical protein n=1 Tax=Treponema sp. TaxID=166 RepID=UPI00298E9A47|nr:hypothetical protein [Treponema sp.]MCQ2599849.1 hypothetical protein [Treponema sp.]
MNFEYIFPILKGVLLNPFVIGTAIVIILYCNFMGYVARYRKKPPKPKKKVVAAPAPAPKPESEEAENSSEPEEE